MADITGEPNEERMHFGEGAREAINSLRNSVAGSAFVSLRTLVLLAISAGCAALAPIPFNVIGVMSMALVAFDVGRRVK
jgi:hypothetical protein